MRTAVVRVNLDPEGRFPLSRLNAAVEELTARGIEVRCPVLATLPPTAREIQLIAEGDDPAELRRWAERSCADALGDTGPAAGPATFLSRGTDEDAHGVLRAFGISGLVDRFYERDEEIALITISRDAAGRVVESRLQTALEAALNCEIRIAVG